MLDRLTYPLEIASQVLKPETIKRVKRTPKLARLAYLMLDRWALNEPEELKALEAKNVEDLLDRVYEQVVTETYALSTPEAAIMQQNGMSDWEILSLLGVDTRVRTLESVWAPLDKEER